MGYFKNLNIKQMNDERTKEFISCLGNGKSIYECESENEQKDRLDYQYACQVCGHLREDCECYEESDD